jgi:hypothetical protein
MAIGRQVGPAVLREYFNEDISELSSQYDAFVEALVRRGNGERIWRGQSPVLNPAESALPKSATPGS